MLRRILSGTLLAAAAFAAASGDAAFSWELARKEVALRGFVPPGLLPDVRDLEPPVLLAGAAVPPAIPPQWISKLRFDGNFAGIATTGGRGHFYYDRPGKRNRMNYTVNVEYFHPDVPTFRDSLNVAGPTRISPAAQNMTFGEGEDGTCLIFSQGTPFSDTFAWLRIATATGQKVIDGQTCTVWSWISVSFGVAFEACVGESGVPSYFNQTFGQPGGKFFGFQYYEFRNATLGDPGDASFVPTVACSANYPSAPCEKPNVIAMDTYRIWGPPEPLELGNRNTGDILGDLSFVCTQGSGPSYESKLISRWRVNVRTDFGQYALCNYNGRDNVCSGPPEQLTRVGRRSGQMAGDGPRIGQCSANDDVGSQYSFHRDAQCPPNVQPGFDQGCAWGGAVVVRTISAKCVMEERGLLEACKKDIGHAPFKDAEAIWAKAFASSDPREGGCPDAALGLHGASVALVV